MYKKEGAINSRSIYFDGNSLVNNSLRGDRILIGDSDAFSFTDGTTDLPFTLAAWVYIVDLGTARQGGPFISKADITSSPSSGTEFLFRHNQNGKIEMYLYDYVNGAQPQKFDSRIKVETNAVVLTSEKWHHVAVTYDGSADAAGLNIYVDGVLITNVDREKVVGANGYERIRNTTTSLMFAGQAGGTQVGAHAFESRMADICIFNKELSASEMAEIYNAGAVKNMVKASTYNNLISWWKMGDDRDGPLSGGIIDYVGGHNGTLVNGATIALEVDLPSDQEENFQKIFRQTSHGKTRQLKFITPPGPRPDYDNILMPLTPHQIESGVAKHLVDTATYPEFANAIPGFRTNPDIKINGVSCSFNTENQRYLIVFMDSLAQPNVSNIFVQIFGFSYALPRWTPLADTRGPGKTGTTAETPLLILGQKNAVQVAKIYEIAGVDKVCMVQKTQANAGGTAATRVFERYDHISMAVCTF